MSSKGILDHSPPLEGSNIPKSPGRPTGDALRLLYLTQTMDGLGDHDLHRLASNNAENNGREEPDDSDYLQAMRFMVDAEMRDAKWPPP